MYIKQICCIFLKCLKVTLYQCVQHSWFFLISSFSSILYYKLCTKLSSKAFVSWQSKSCGSISKLMYTTCPSHCSSVCVICTRLAEDYRGCQFSMMHIFTVSITAYRHDNLTFIVTQLSLTHSHTSRFLLWVWMMKGSLHILRRSPCEVENIIINKFIQMLRN